MGLSCGVFVMSLRCPLVVYGTICGHITQPEDPFLCVRHGSYLVAEHVDPPVSTPCMLKIHYQSTNCLKIVMPVARTPYLRPLRLTRNYVSEIIWLRPCVQMSTDNLERSQNPTLIKIPGDVTDFVFSSGWPGAIQSTNPIGLPPHPPLNQ